ncbi:hypothetical protein ZIOFF_007652 [Zingiber officinale]|uniref:Peptidase C14 caspase domain-containing protein n=1 Tax=Zingiber officinale TaxID=94328 RepID=A0A8J5HXJ2_ZINOF|nr:hypothetical protein ZIOFF_007652 [Zingiber officinale]
MDGGKSQQQQQKRLAVLVGCNYEHTRFQLSGCINDARSMRHLLLSRFAFSPDDVLLLTDDAVADSPHLFPTGANIRSALAAMVDRAAPGDVLFFHYSGHGTLVDPVWPLHHRDEAIVPCDFNLITGAPHVDFRELVNRVPSGATFTIVSDSCHSGGLIDHEKEQIGPSSTVAAATASPPSPTSRTLPLESVVHHLAALSNLASPNIADHLVELFGSEVSAKFASSHVAAPRRRGDDEGILLSGCQTNETSADMEPEADGEASGEAYGAFTSAIRMVLLQRKEGEVVSNRELVMGARRLLRTQGLSQHPCLYCSDVNAEKPFLMWPLTPAPAPAEEKQKQGTHASSTVIETICKDGTVMVPDELLEQDKEAAKAALDEMDSD